jgi:hypothetical protein
MAKFDIISLMHTAHSFVNHGMSKAANIILQASHIPEGSKKSAGHLESTCRLMVREQMDTHIINHLRCQRN